jgi:hypothetical protein
MLYCDGSQLSYPLPERRPQSQYPARRLLSQQAKIAITMWSTAAIGLDTMDAGYYLSWKTNRTEKNS